MDYRRLIPNMCTSSNLVFGMCSILSTYSGNLVWGSIFILLALVADGLDGRTARFFGVASEMGKGQDDTVFIFDEPTIGLHPLDVASLLDVFQGLIGQGATVLVIEHDQDVIANADYVVDLGPGGGKEGGRIVVSGTPEAVMACPSSLTGKYLRLNRKK